VAAKSPLTGGFGDGNLGTRATEHIRKSGYDALILKVRLISPFMFILKTIKSSIFRLRTSGEKALMTLMIISIKDMAKALASYPLVRVEKTLTVMP